MANRSPARLCAACALGNLLATSVATAQQQYSVTNLGTLPADHNLASEAWDVNNAGQVVGASYRKITVPTESDGFLWTPTTPNGTSGSMVRMTPTGGGGTQINAMGQVAGVDDPAVSPNYAHVWTPTTPNGSTGTATPLPSLPDRPINIAYAINDSGQVAGYAANYTPGSQRPERAYLWKPSSPNGTSGTIIDLGELAGGNDESYAFGVNNFGQVVGRSHTANGTRAFLWQPTSANAMTGTLTNLGVAAGHPQSEAAGINDSGHVVGASYTSTISKIGHAALWTPTTANGASGSFIDLGDLPGGFDYSYAIDLNESNTIVGYANAAAGQRAAVWFGGAGAIDLNTLTDGSGASWTLEIARGINDFGQIVGSGMFDPDGAGPAAAVERAFLLTPVPEPALGSALLLSAALLLRRRRAARR